MRMRLVSLLVIPALAYAVCSEASTIRFDDLGETISVTLDGVAITGNGGRISNFTLVGEQVSFDIAIDITKIGQITVAGFTNLLDPIGSDDPPNTVSDRIIDTYTAGTAFIHIAFGSDPDLPAIPPGTIDLTTIPGQGLPPNPYYEDGTFQKVATSFNFDGSVIDTYFARSDVPVPEPSTLLLLGTGLVGLLGYGWRRRKKAA